METSGVLAEIRRALKDLKAKGHVGIGIDAFLEYLGKIEGQVAGNGAMRPEFRENASLAQYQVESENMRVFHQVRTQEHTEFNRFAIETGQSALRSAMLINGGAAVAVLAFVGTAWGSGMPPEIFTQIAKALGSFAFGVLSAAFGAGTAYLVQRAFVEGLDSGAEQGSQQHPDEQGDSEKGGATRDWDKIGYQLNYLAVVFVIASFVLFGFGAYLAYNALVSLSAA